MVVRGGGRKKKEKKCYFSLTSTVWAGHNLKIQYTPKLFSLFTVSVEMNLLECSLCLTDSRELPRYSTNQNETRSSPQVAVTWYLTESCFRFQV